MKEPCEKIAIDIHGPLSCRRKGYRYVLFICDYATRYTETNYTTGYPEVIPLHHADAH